MTTIYLIRHGQSAVNAGMPITKTDSDLTEKGIQQAKNVAKQLGHIPFDAVFSSDYIRARRTAEIIATERNLAVKTTELIRERSLGKAWIENREKVRAEMREALKQLNEQEKMKYKHTPDMESAEEAVSRLITFLREAALAYQDKTIAVVAHGNLMRSFLIHVGWATFDELPVNSVENTGYMVLECDGTDFFVKETDKITKV